jgi:hypothetical protein
MKNLEKMMARVLGIAAMVVMFASCTNEEAPMMRSTGFDPQTPFYGEKIINDSTKRDSVVIDGKVERIDLKFTIRAREDREVFVDDFNSPQAEEYFSSDRRLLDSRQEGNWMVYTYVTNPHKGVQVGPTGETVSYETLEEVATYVPTYHDFTSQGWEVMNVSDVFVGAEKSSKEGYTELDYTNGIKATYTGVSTSKVVNLQEKIFFFAKGDVPVPDPVVIKDYEHNGDRNDFTTHTSVVVEKIAIYSDGSRETVDKPSANLAITVTPETNWTLNVDQLGTYVANAFSYTLISKEPKKSGNFSYNEYTYRASNTVAGKTNSVLIKVPNDIVYEDKDIRHEFANTGLSVAKGNEATTFRSEDDSKKTYGYTCVANVIFGASQAVTLPGTINVKKAEPQPEPNHEHGKVKDVIFTTTQDENKSYYKSVCVIVFEDGYRSIGMTDNGSKVFSFTMSSTVSGVNSAVYDGKWVPSKANDDSTCMIWRNESGAKKRVLDYISATAQKWNNGHNTISDPRRSYTIIDGGYGVTLSLNGSAGQTLHF